MCGQRGCGCVSALYLRLQFADKAAHMKPVAHSMVDLDGDGQYRSAVFRKGSSHCKNREQVAVSIFQI